MPISIPLEIKNKTGPGWDEFVRQAQRAGVKAGDALKQLESQVARLNNQEFLKNQVDSLNPKPVKDFFDEFVKGGEAVRARATGAKNPLAQQFEEARKSAFSFRDAAKSVNDTNIAWGHERQLNVFGNMLDKMPALAAGLAAAGTAAAAFHHTVSEGIKAEIPEYIRLRDEIQGLGTSWSRVGQVWASDGQMKVAVTNASEAIKTLKGDLYDVGTGAKGARMAIGEFLEARGLLATKEQHDARGDGVLKPMEQMFAPWVLHRDASDNVRTIKENARRQVEEHQKSLRGEDAIDINNQVRDLDKSGLLALRDRTQAGQKITSDGNIEGTVSQEELEKSIAKTTNLLAAITQRLAQIDHDEHAMNRRFADMQRRRAESKEADAIAEMTNIDQMNIRLIEQKRLMEDANAPIKEREAAMNRVERLESRLAQVTKERNREAAQQAKQEHDDMVQFHINEHQELLKKIDLQEQLRQQAIKTREEWQRRDVQRARDDFQQHQSGAIQAGENAGVGNLFQQLSGNNSERALRIQQAKDLRAKGYTPEMIRQLRGAAKRSQSGTGNALDEMDAEVNASSMLDAQRTLNEKQLKGLGMSNKATQQAVNVMDAQANQAGQLIQEVGNIWDALGQVADHVNLNQRAMQQVSQKKRWQKLP